MPKRRGSDDEEEPCYFHMTGGCTNKSCKKPHPVPPLDIDGELIVCRFDHHDGGCRKLRFCPFKHPRAESRESPTFRPTPFESNNSRGPLRTRPRSSSRNVVIVTDDSHRRDTAATKRSRSDSGPSKRPRTQSSSWSVSPPPERKHSELKKKMEIKLKKLEDKLTTTEKKVRDLEEELQKSKNLVDYKNEIIQNSLTKISDLSMQLSQKNEELESLQEENSKITKTVEDQQMINDDLKSDLENQKADLSNLEDDSQANETERNELHSKIVEQANQMAILEKMLAKVQKEREEMEVERDNFDDENVDFKEKMKSLKLQYESEVNELKVKLRDRDSETNRLRDTNTELIANNKNLQSSLEGREGAMKESFLKLENLKSTKVKIEKENNVLRNQLEKLQSEMSSLKSEKTRKEGEFSEELKIREMVITTLKKDLASSAKKSEDNLQAAFSRENSLQSQVEEYSKSLNSKEGAMTEAYRSIEILKIDREKYVKEKANLVETCDRIKSEKSVIESDRDNLAKKVIALEKDDSRSKTEMKTLREKLKEYGTTLAASDAEKLKFGEKIQELERSVINLEKEKEKITLAEEVKGVFIVSLESNIKQFKKDVNDMKKELRKKDVQLKRYEEEVLPLLRSEFN